MKASLLRPKKISLVSRNRPGENFLSPTRESENIDFLFQKNTHTKKKIPTSKFIRTNLRFFPLNNKCFSTEKSALRVVF